MFSEYLHLGHSRLTCELFFESADWFPCDTLEVVYPRHRRYMAETIPIYTKKVSIH